MYEPQQAQQEHLYNAHGAYQQANGNHVAQYQQQVQQQQQQHGVQPAQHATAQPPVATEPIHHARMADADVMYFAFCWIPIEVFTASDLRERIAGAGDSHFAHILSKHGKEVLELGFEGLPNAQAPVNQRLKVTMKSPNPEIAKNAFTDLLDLVQTMVELVAEELGTFQSWQIEQMGANISTEMFVMNHGERQEIPKERSGKKVEVIGLDESASDEDYVSESAEEVHERDRDHRIGQQQPTVQADLPTEDGEYELVSDEDDDNQGGSTGSESDLTDHEGVGDEKYQPF